MSADEREPVYRIFDPTGNLTALVESPVPPERQPEAAAALMRRHPELEQVGFVRLTPEGETRAALRMAGGEFCGNATMSAAALLCLREGLAPAEPALFRLRVSGAERPVEVRLEAAGENCFRGAVHMPAARTVSRMAFAFGGAEDELSLVRLAGISHLVIPAGSLFFALREEPAAAESALRQWCGELGAEGLGLMFLEGRAPRLRLTPLVYVPGSGTVFWERSCASGSAAVGMALAAQTGERVSLTLEQPGGSLRAESDPQSGETWLHGTTRLIL